MPDDLKQRQRQQGALLAPDGIPLHFGDQHAEYDAAHNAVALLDRSHEARLELHGAGSLDVLHRISTNALTDLLVGAGRPTIFTNANARILDRVEVYRLEAERLLLLGEPGRTPPLQNYLQRNIFYGDDARLVPVDAFALDLLGPLAVDLLARLSGVTLEAMQVARVQIGATPVVVARRKAVGVPRLSLLVAPADVAEVWRVLVENGATPAGSLTYNVLRVQSGSPSLGRELTTDFIPLELGLWDEVSFTKGCYTGQEIIARLESRSRLAKMLVTLDLPQVIDAPADIHIDGRRVGQLTSCVSAPTGEVFALGVIKPDQAQAGTEITIGPAAVRGKIIAPAGVQAHQSN